MDDLKKLSAKISALGDIAKEQAAYLQAMSRQANQLAQMIDSYIHGTAGNVAADICTSLINAGEQTAKACYALMQAWNVSQHWLSNHVPVAPVIIPPIGGAQPSFSPLTEEDDPNLNKTKAPVETINSASNESRDSSDRVTMQGYRRINTPHSAFDDLKNTNPKWAEDSPWDVNCQRCVSAYEARRRGYDVTAAPLVDSHDPLQIMRHPNGWPSVYKGADLIDCTAASGTASEVLVNEKMAEWGDGARAIVRVRWQLGGGHVFIAERVNGQTVYVDPQRGTEDVGYYFQSAKGNGTFCVRIDNLPFTNRIHDCVV